MLHRPCFGIFAFGHAKQASKEVPIRSMLYSSSHKESVWLEEVVVCCDAIQWFLACLDVTEWDSFMDAGRIQTHHLNFIGASFTDMPMQLAGLVLCDGRGRGGDPNIFMEQEEYDCLIC